MAGADLNLQRNDGATAVMIASQNGEIIKMLLDAGANPNIRDKTGKTILMKFLKQHHIGDDILLCKELIKKSNLFIKDSNGDSAIEILLKLPPHKIFFLLEDSYCSKITGDHSCSICLDTSDLIQLHCNHTYHSECIQTWLKTENTCPLCRSQII